jgi:Mn-dependent DtxR family transcriptional regulator
MRKNRVSVERLVSVVVRHWNANSTMSAAAAELRLTPGTVCARLKRLRKLGVRGLPEWGMARRRKRGIAARARAVLAKNPAQGV